jgi:hypothetical protein
MTAKFITTCVFAASLVLTGCGNSDGSGGTDNPLFKTAPQEAYGSGLYPNDFTKWSVNGNEINVSVTCDGCNEAALDQYPWISKGVRYQPTPLGMSSDAAGTPMGDYFYVGNNNGTPMFFYEDIWKRDLNLMREAGINSLGVYTTYNVAPLTWDPDEYNATKNSATKLCASYGPGVCSAANSNFASQINWDVLGPLRYTDGQPTAMPVGIDQKSTPVATFWYHYNHDRFLDLCWNGGNKPVYVWLSVGVSLSAFYAANPSATDGTRYTQWEEYYKKSAEWLAKSYGNHPAVIGFILTNETNTADTYPSFEYWHFLNEINGIFKKYAPDKLTMIGFQDNPDTLKTPLSQYVTTPVPGQSAPATEPLYVEANGSITTVSAGNKPAYSFNVYKPDVWGWNLYAVANNNTDIIQFYKSKLSGTPYEKPIILSEIGIPQALRHPIVAGENNGTQGGNDPYYTNPNGYKVDANGSSVLYDANRSALGADEPLPILSMTAAERGAFSADANASEYGGGLVVYETDTQKYYLLVGNPTAPSADWVQLTNPAYTALLDAWRAKGYVGPGAAIALYAGLKAAESYHVDVASTNADKILSGEMVFEFGDEWYKWVDPHIDKSKEDASYGVHDFRDSAIQGWGPADAQFMTVWEEEWFGMFAASPACGRASTDSPISPSGYLAVGPDIMTPRAAYFAMADYYGASPNVDANRTACSDTFTFSLENNMTDQYGQPANVPITLFWGTNEQDWQKLDGSDITVNGVVKQFNFAQKPYHLAVKYENDTLQACIINNTDMDKVLNGSTVIGQWVAPDGNGVCNVK